MSGQGGPAIKVNWGSTNAHAYVQVKATNQGSCESDVFTLPVRIHVELQTETPHGQDSVCLNQQEGQMYRVVYTNGSIYTWGIEGGVITEGQGTSQVKVNWGGEGLHKLWLQERSVTKDTVCFGISNTLMVRVFKDTTRLQLDFISVDEMNDSLMQVHWQSSNPDRIAGTYQLLRRMAGSGTWEPVADIAGSSTYIDKQLLTDEHVYEYQVRASNACNEGLESTIHASIRLSGTANQADDQIHLQWTEYTGWKSGVTQYELWRKLDAEIQYQRIEVLNASTLSFESFSGQVGFTHRYRIKAIARESGFASWSNESVLEFSHELAIPNIVTPNGDGKNETFRFTKLDMYPENELVIYDRWGKEVFRQKGYTGDWSGNNVHSGTYFYEFTTQKFNRRLRGWLQVLR